MQEQLLHIFAFGTIGILGFSFLSILLSLFRANPLESLYLKVQTELIFFVSLFATFGSILLSLYFGLAPCDLCWYQRMFLFPIPIIAFLATVTRNTSGRIYTLALSCVGLAIATYHSLLQMGFLGESSVFCNPGSASDCSTPDFVYYGFVTVPVISFSIFLLLIIISYPYAPKNK